MNKIVTFILVAAIGCISAHAQTTVNVGHLAPFDATVANTAVSVDVDGTEVLNPVVFNEFSGYLELAPAGTAPGDTDVDIIVPPGSGMAAISDTFNLPADSDFTVVAIGDDAGGGGNQPLELLALSDDLSAPNAGNAKVRVAHTAPFAANIGDTAVSVRLDDGTVVNGLSSVEFKVDSGFFELPAGTYDLQIATPDGSTTLINPEPVTLADGDIVTLFAVGDGANQDLGVTAVFDDGTFAVLPLEPSGPVASVNVGHLAPFAPAAADTEVSVDVDGNEVLGSVFFNQFSGFLDLAPGDTDVDIIVPPGSGTTAISDTFMLPADADFTVVAIGDDAGAGGNQPLELLALSDDLSAPSAGNAKVRVAHTAPFAAALPATAVSVRLDDGTVVNGLTSVEYKQDSGFFELPAGTYDLQITLPGGSPTVIDPAPVTLADGDIVTLFAVGDGENQALGITAVFGDGTFAALPLAGDVPEPQEVPTLSTIALLTLLMLVGLIAWRKFS